MCLTIPKKILSVDGVTARVKSGTINVSLIPRVKAGDWVLVNADLAVRKVPAAEAKKILTLLSHV
ncbi:MAG: HypC/HybG/HupF family hydrogenase formation chaperone [Patescibacteria group bacterium]